MIRHITIEVPQGNCLEVVGCAWPHDGRLLGYAIFFAGSWDAYYRDHLGHLVECGKQLTKEGAIESVASCVGPDRR